LLGTTQSLTVERPGGELKARISAAQPAAQGDTVGRDFDPGTITLLDRASGRALRSALNEEVLAHG